MKRVKSTLLLLCSIIVAIILLGCSTPPAESEVQELIIRHYEARGYRVSELVIREITNIPLRDREYMSTKGHLVHISSITVAPVDAVVGEAVAFSDAVIEIHRSRDESRGWIISNISGIAVR